MICLFLNLDRVVYVTVFADKIVDVTQVLNVGCGNWAHTLKSFGPVQVVVTIGQLI